MHQIGCSVSTSTILRQKHQIEKEHEDIIDELVNSKKKVKEQQNYKNIMNSRTSEESWYSKDLEDTFKQNRGTYLAPPCSSPDPCVPIPCHALLLHTTYNIYRLLTLQQSTHCHIHASCKTSLHTTPIDSTMYDKPIGDSSVNVLDQFKRLSLPKVDFGSGYCVDTEESTATNYAIAGKWIPLLNAQSPHVDYDIVADNVDITISPPHT
jgi:hypothetical protein